jgi:hypothetical protein
VNRGSGGAADPYHRRVAIPVPLRLRRRGGGSERRLRFRLLGAVATPLALLALAPTAMARPGAPAPSAALLPSALPSVCVGGVVLCGGNVVTLPTKPPVAIPSICVGSLCPVGVPTPPGPAVTPPTNQPSAKPTSGPSTAPTTAVTPAQVAVAAALPAPPGVGLVPPANLNTVQDSLSPDSFATVMSLSLGDGLGGVRNHVWPWLLAIQLVLWTAIAFVAWWRQLGSPPHPRRS